MQQPAEKILGSCIHHHYTLIVTRTLTVNAQLLPNRNFQPKESVQSLPKIHETRSCQSLKWQKLTGTDQCVRDLSLRI